MKQVKSNPNMNMVQSKNSKMEQTNLIQPPPPPPQSKMSVP